jgi:hypothetical protein
MEELRTVVVTVIGAILTMLAPIQNFMYAMVLLFSLNFIFGIVAARVNKEGWKTKKALMFFVYCAIFFVTACAVFIIGHFMGEHQQAITVVKILCYLAVYVFGTNIFRNLCQIVPQNSTWYKLFDLCYYMLSVKFIEKFPFIKKRQEDLAGASSHNTILDKDDN